MTNPAFSPTTTWRRTPHVVTFTQHLPTPSTVSGVTIEAEHQAAHAFAKANQTQPPGATSVMGISRILIDGFTIEALRTKHRTVWRINGQPEPKVTVEALIHLQWDAATVKAAQVGRGRKAAIAAIRRSLSRP